MNTKQNITILGSTGSIGKNTLDVIQRHPDKFSIYALTANTQTEQMLEQCKKYQPAYAAMADEKSAQELEKQIKAAGLKTQILAGHQNITQLAAHQEVTTVMAAIVGAAGLAPCIAAANAGKKLLLANKEALVVGGEIFLSAVKNGGATLLPIDSEHSAIFQCLPEDKNKWNKQIDKLILTSSGGPFRQTPIEKFNQITPAEACAHPNFVMGQKISIDSATMMNKALEVIEARWLFNIPAEKIQVIIHPQQIIHSMVQFTDASILAQLGTPDMRVPIAYGLSHPERIQNGTQNLDFTKLAALTFEEPQKAKYPALYLAWQVLKEQAGTSAVLNAANEIAVSAFLRGQINFTQIHQTIEKALQKTKFQTPKTLEELLELDKKTRQITNQIIT